MYNKRLNVVTLYSTIKQEVGANKSKKCERRLEVQTKNPKCLPHFGFSKRYKGTTIDNT